MRFEEFKSFKMEATILTYILIIIYVYFDTM